MDKDDLQDELAEDQVTEDSTAGPGGRTISIKLAMVLVALLTIALVIAWRAEEVTREFFGPSVRMGSSTTWLANFYELKDDTLQNDGEFLAYCLQNFPEAVCKEPDWSSYDDVLANFVDHPEQWAALKREHGGVMFITWAQHKFGGYWCYIIDPLWPYADSPEYHELSSGWLYVNGVKVTAYDAKTYDMDPAEIVKLYWTDWWSGRGYLRSADFGTVASINGDGELVYSYYAESSPNKDCGVEGYLDYAKPWWADLIAKEDENLNNAKYASYLNMSYYEVPQGFRGHCRSGIYPDLPLGYDVGTIYLSDWYDEEFVANSQDSGLLLITDTGAMQFSHGSLLTEWQFDVGQQPDRGFIRLKRAQSDESGYLAYVSTGERLLGLKDGGRYDVLLEQIVSYAGISNALFGLNGEQLIYWETNGDTVVLAEDVSAADFYHMALFEKADGCYAIVPTVDDSYYGYNYIEISCESSWEIIYLGSGSLAEYRELYDTIESGSHIHY